MSRTKRRVNKRPTQATATKQFPWPIALSVVAILSIAVVAFVAWKSRSAIAPPEIPTDVDHAIVAAVESARDAVIDSPRDGQAWGELGMTLMAHEFVDQAATSFEQATKYAPNDPRWPYLNARCIDQINPDRAIELLRKSVAICGNQPDAPRLYLVELLLQQQRLDEASSELDSFFEFSPKNVRARHAKARFYALQGNYQACADEIKSVNLDTKDKYAAMLSRYKELIRTGRNKEAQKVRLEANQMLQTGLAKQKSIGLLLASAYRSLGQVDDAERQRQFAESQDDHGWTDPFTSQVKEREVGQKALLVKADLLFGNAKYDESNALLQRIISEYPDTLFGRIYLARGYIRLGRIAIDKNSDADTARRHFQHARQILNNTLEKNPNAPEALFRLAVATAYLADLDSKRELYLEAADIYRKAISVKSDFTMAYFNLANCLDRTGDLQGAIEAMRGTVRCEPNHVEGNAVLGLLLSRTDQKDEARKHLERALKLNPNHQVARQTLNRLKPETVYPQ